MAEDIIKIGLERGYSIDEIADILATDAGYDPAVIRDRGYSSDEILGKLGYPIKAPEAIPTEEVGDTSRGFKRSFAQVPELAYGAAALAAQSAEKIFGEGGLSTTAKEYFGSKFLQKQQANKEYAPSVEFTDAWNNLGTEPGKMIDWLQDTAGYVVGQGLQTIATGGIGALAGRAALSGTTEKLLGSMVAKQADKLIAKGIAADVASKMAAKDIAGMIGAGVVLNAQNLGMEAGDIYGGLNEQVSKEGRSVTSDDLWRAWGAAGAAALTETATDLLGLGALTGKIRIGGKAIQELGGIGGRAARAGATAAVGMPLEGAQEYIQTGLEQFGAGVPLNTEDAARERINATAVGALGGGLMGGGIGAIQKQQKADAAFAAIPRANTVDEAIAAANAAIDVPIQEEIIGGQDGGIAQNTDAILSAPSIAQGGDQLAGGASVAPDSATALVGRDVQPAGIPVRGGGIDTSSGATDAREALVSDQFQQPINQGEVNGLQEAAQAEEVKPVIEQPAQPASDAGQGAGGARPTQAAQPMDVPGAQPVTAPSQGEASQPTNSLSRTASWVIKNKETGEVIMETFDQAKVDALNVSKYEAVPILEYLQSLNKKADTTPPDAGKVINTQPISLQSSQPATPIANAENISTSPERVSETAENEQASAALDIQAQQKTAAPSIDRYLKQDVSGKWQLSRPVPVKNRPLVVAEMEQRNQEIEATAQAQETKEPAQAEAPQQKQGAPGASKAIVAVEDELRETRNPPEVSTPMATGGVKFETLTFNGPKIVSAKLYELPGYKGPQLAVATYKARMGQGYRIYLPKSGMLLQDNNGVGDLPSTLKIAVQRINQAKLRLAAEKPAVAQKPEASRLNPVAESQAPEPSEPSDGGVEPAQEKAAPAKEVQALTKDAAQRLARQFNDDTVAAPHPTKPGMWALMSKEEAEAQKPDPVATAKKVLDAAGITGTDRTTTIAAVRRGDLTAEDVAEAHPAKGKETPASLPSEAAKEKEVGAGGAVAESGDALEARAYHGSPYKFDKFTLDHIGKGEGAQAFGFGLYFAEKKDVAEYYRQQLSKQIVNVDGKKVATIDWNKQKDREKIARALGFTEKREIDDAQTLLRSFFFSGGKWDYVAKDVAEYSDYFRPGYEAAFARMKGRVDIAHKGQLYEVEIPEDSEYLLFDSPISKLPGSAKSALFEGSPDSIAGYAKTLSDGIERKSFVAKGFSGLDVPTQRRMLSAVFKAAKNGEIFDAIVELIPIDVMNVLVTAKASPDVLFHNEAMLHDLLSGTVAAGPTNNAIPMWSDVAGSIVQAVARATTEYAARKDGAGGSENSGAADGAMASNLHIPIINELGQNATGKEFYAALSARLGSDEAASKYLNSLGIAGIKYLDGTSRNRPLREVKREFLAELPEDADFAEVEELLGTGTFSPANEAVIKALQADDWLGFDYPAQALSVALGDKLAGFDASKALKDAVAAAQDGSTYNYVIFDDNAVKVLQTFYEARQGSATITGETPATIRSALVSAFGDRTVSNLERNNLLKIISTAGDLPNNLRISDAGVAIFDYDTAYLIADRMQPKTAAKILLHEIGEHAGLEKMLGTEGYAALKKRVRNLEKLNTFVRRAFAEVRKSYPEYSEDSDEFMHEVLAAIGQEASIQKLAWWKELIAAVKRFLVKMGFTATISDRDVQDMVVHSLKMAAQENRALAGATQAGALAAKVGAGKTAFKAVDTESPEFKRWFGDSKVVDADGKPLVVYHGTAKVGYTEFGTNNVGAFFSDRFDIAASYAGRYNEVEFDEEGAYTEDGTEQGVYETYLSIKNPLVVDWGGNLFVDGPDGLRTDDIAARAKREGYDGLIIENVADVGSISPGLVEDSGAGTVYVAFSPTQIKSATSNTGRFDPTNPSILEARSKIIDDNNRTRTPEQLAMFKRVGRTVEIPTVAERVKAFRQDFWKKATQGLVDQFAPIKELSKEAYGLMRLSKGATGAFEVFMQGGQLKLTDGAYDFDDTKKGGVIDKLLTPLQNESGDFLWWIAANRAEKLAAEDRENLWTPADIAAGKTLADGTTDFDYTLQHGARKGQVTRDRTLIYADAQKTFNEFHKNALDMAEQSGLIDPVSRATWESEFYVPFYRVDEDGGFRGVNIKSGAVRQEAFKRLKGGSEKLNADLLENTLMNWAHLIDAAAKNRAAGATIKAAVDLGIAQEVPSGTKGAVWVQEGGKKKHYTISDPYVLTALTALEYAGLRGGVMDVLSATKHWLTIGVTASPFFKVRNLIRDSIQVIGTSDISYNPAKNLAEGFKATKRGTDEYFRMLAGGGLIRFGTMLEGNEANRTRALVEKGVDPSTILDNESKIKAFYKRTLEPLIEAYNELGNRGEEINRAALYKQLRAQGFSHAEASLEARDLMDFSMQGAWASVRFLTQVVPFMNARLQGMYKLGRASKKDTARMATVIGAATMISLGLLAAYGDDDEWEKREDWDRNNYWWFRVGGIAYRIPKPFEIGAVATLAERMAEYLFDDEMTGKRFAQQVRHIMSDQLAMNPVPQAFKPLIDLYANKDSFSGRPIETMGMEKLAPEYRFRQGTSMVARGISTAGNKVANAAGVDFLSPVQIDHLIRGYFSWLGAFIVGGADLAIRAASNEPTRPAIDYWKTATGGMISETSGAPSRYVSQMYDQAKELEEAHGTWRNLLKEGKTTEAREYQAENRDKLLRYKSVEAIKREESRINYQIRLVERSNDSPETKKAKINVLRARQNNIAKALSMRRAQ